MPQYSLSLKNRKNDIKIFTKFCGFCIKWKAKRSFNFLEPDDKNDKYFQTKKWYIINGQNNGQYDENSAMKFNTEVIKPNLCDYAMHIF